MPESCFDIVRAGDKDRFLALLFAPDAARPHLLALYAFNVEVARIAHLVSEPQVGEIRLQWWHDTLDGIYGGETQAHPVAAALAETISLHHLPQEPLHNLVKARQFDLYADQMPSLTALEGYLGETSSALLQLSCLVLSPRDAALASDAAGLGGVAYGLAKRIGDRKLLPPGMTHDELVQHAEKRLAEAASAINALPRSLFPVFLPVALTRLYLNATASGKTVPQWKKQWTLWRAARWEKV